MGEWKPWITVKFGKNGTNWLSEEKVDIDELVLPSKLTLLPEVEILDVKEEPIEVSVHEEEMIIAFESSHDRKNQYKLKIQETISKLYEELDREKCENSIVNFSQKRSLKSSKILTN